MSLFLFASPWNVGPTVLKSNRHNTWHRFLNVLRTRISDDEVLFSRYSIQFFFVFVTRSLLCMCNVFENSFFYFCQSKSDYIVDYIYDEVRKMNWQVLKILTVMFWRNCQYKLPYCPHDLYSPILSVLTHKVSFASIICMSFLDASINVIHLDLDTRRLVHY